MQPTEKISQFGTKSTLDPADYIPIVDSVTGTNKRVSGAVVSTSLATATNGWNNLNYTPTYLTNDGNKQHTVQVASVDLTPTLSPGMKMKLTRGTTAPTQSMAFIAASSQYATKASPTGLAFTAAFTLEAWVYLTSYTGAGMTFISRRSGSTGNFTLGANASGQPYVGYGDGTGGFTTFQAIQSLPLFRPIHLAGVVTSTSGKTGILYINGLPVAATLPVATATSLVQTGNLSLGTYGPGSGEFMNGYMSEARVWSVAQSQSQIQSNMSLSLTTATNLVANFPGNGNFNDVSGVGNNLTATNGAIATNAYNPANNIEYAIITKVAYSAPNTVITLFTGTDCNIPNMTLNNAQYSTARSPFGFPGSRTKWVSQAVYKNLNQQTGATQNIWYNPNTQLSLPIGEWDLVWQAVMYANNTTQQPTIFVTLSTASNTEIDPEYTQYGYVQSTNYSFELPGTKRKPFTQSALGTIYLNIKTDKAGGAAIGLDGSAGTTTITAECPYV